MDNLEKKSLFGRIETKFAADDTATGTMSGYGAVFGNVDSYGDIIAPGAFKDSLAQHKAEGTLPLMLLNHGLWDLPIGIWDSMEEDDIGLKVAGHFIDNIRGQDAYKTAKAGAITGLSIGFVVTDFEMRNNNRIITGVQLIEVSLVTLPANDLARVSNVKSQENEMTNTIAAFTNTSVAQANAEDASTSAAMNARAAASSAIAAATTCISAPQNNLPAQVNVTVQTDAKKAIAELERVKALLVDVKTTLADIEIEVSVKSTANKSSDEEDQNCDCESDEDCDCGDQDSTDEVLKLEKT
jgi:HK97 family phage prohead protease